VTRRTAEAHERIEREIAQEKAATLGRAGERLEAALAELAALRRAWHAAGATGRTTLAAEYDRAWRAAETARLILVIQREAVGLRHHRDVEQQFPRPPRRPEGRP
jgi:hypothetical protein